MRLAPDARLSIAFFVHSVPFTEAVLKHETSLGGSESACRVLAEALAARGHDVHVFATQLEAPGEYFGVFWHRDSEMHDVFRFAAPHVFVSLRMPHIFRTPIAAQLRILWTQDLLIDKGDIGALYAIDKTVFVSQYHREQWCNLAPELRPTAWVTNNPINPGDLVAAAGGEGFELPAKINKRLIHISRPERGIDGVIKLWPEIRKRHPDATIAICRYSSMYDKGGWGKVCEQYDRRLEALNESVGGIVWLGELNKAQLYREIAQAVAMFYPTTQENFAETNCVAATEAQACGTPIIASRRGALPETVHPLAGILIDGDVLADGDVQARFYQAVDDVFAMHAAPEENHDAYAKLQRNGHAHASRSYGPAVAQAWETMLRDTFERRYQDNKLAVLRQLLHWDNHEHARLVALDILTGEGLSGTENVAEAIADVRRLTENEPRTPDVDRILEAADAWELCGRVMRQEEQTAEHYAKYAAPDPHEEAQHNTRMHQAADRIVAHLAKMRAAGQLRDRDGKERGARILDVSCGNGSMAICLLERAPADTVVHGVDYSAGVIALARKATEETYGRRARFWQIADSMDLSGFYEARADEPGNASLYDAVFCGEFIEHIPAPWQLLDSLEHVCHPEGLVMLTTPCGPFAELLERGIPRQRGHVHSFSLQDLSTMGAQKRNFGWSYLAIGHSRRGTACGYWIFGFQPGGGRAQPIDYDLGILTTRPYQRLNAAMIVRDGAAWLRKCLDSLWGVVDRIVIVDTGSTDGSIAIAEGDYGADVYSANWPHDFSVARNASLDLAQRDAEWILWIDADEHLQNPHALRGYTVDAGLFAGYVVRQVHLCADQAQFEDKPVRVFRTGRGVRFYGVVHEQPEQGLNKGIHPVLDQRDVRVIHFGYEDEPTRRSKMKVRNLPLLIKEISGQATHPPRDLSWVLYMRDAVNLATWEIEKTNGRRTVQTHALAQKALDTYYAKKLDDPASMLHELAWPFYQQALNLLGHGFEVAWQFAAAPGRLEGVPAAQRFLVRSPAEIQRLTEHQIRQWTSQLTMPTIDIEPYTPPIDVDPTFLSRGVDSRKLREIAMSAMPAGGDPYRLAHWLGHFTDALATIPTSRPIPPSVDLGSGSPYAAIGMLRTLEALGLHGEVLTVDRRNATATKQALAAFERHTHMPFEPVDWLSPAYRFANREEYASFLFAIVTGTDFEQAYACIESLFGRRQFGQPRMVPGGIVIVDDIRADARMVPWLRDMFPRHLVLHEAKWGEAYATLRVPVVLTDRSRQEDLQTSAASAP